MEKLMVEYDGLWVPKELCTIDREGGADDCNPCSEDCTKDCNDCAVQKCFDKLAKYEATGLNPEEIEALVIFKRLSEVPEEHPFEQALLCKLYYYDGRPTYVTKPAYDAYTYPEYDSDSMAFSYRHHDMEAETADDVERNLIDLIDGFDGDIKHREFVEICRLFNVPQEHVESCLAEYLENEG